MRPRQPPHGTPEDLKHPEDPRADGASDGLVHNKLRAKETISSAQQAAHYDNWRASLRLRSILVFARLEQSTMKHSMW